MYPADLAALDSDELHRLQDEVGDKRYIKDI